MARGENCQVKKFLICLWDVRCVSTRVNKFLLLLQRLSRRLFFRGLSATCRSRWPGRRSSDRTTTTCSSGSAGGGSSPGRVDTSTGSTAAATPWSTRQTFASCFRSPSGFWFVLAGDLVGRFSFSAFLIRININTWMWKLLVEWCYVLTKYIMQNLIS